MAKEKAPAMQFYGREFYQDENVIVMTLEQEAAYIRFLWNCWQEGSIPSELTKLAALCKHSSLKYFTNAIWPALQSCFEPTEAGRLTNRKVEEIRGERQKYLERCSTGGKHSAEKRAEKRKVTSSDLASAPEVTLDSTCQPNPTLQSPVSSLHTPQPLLEAFEPWVAGYPNAVRVDTALQSWLSLIDLGEITEETLPEVFAGLQRWKESAKWAEDDGKWIPAPSVFLTGSDKHVGRLWKDHPPASAETKANRKSAKRSRDGADPNAEWIPSWKKDEVA